MSPYRPRTCFRICRHVRYKKTPFYRCLTLHLPARFYHPSASDALPSATSHLHLPHHPGLLFGHVSSHGLRPSETGYLFFPTGEEKSSPSKYSCTSLYHVPWFAFREKGKTGNLPSCLLPAQLGSAHIKFYILVP
jgi:hypothetical protein